MADRVKYFLLGLLFLVVAGVIAFDRWNSREAMGPADHSARAEDGEGRLWFDPPNRDEEEVRDDDAPPISIVPPFEEEELPTPEPKPVVPVPKPQPKPEPGPVPARETIHVVRSGETLGEIAARYYPGRVQSGIRMIVKANAISNPNRIRENDKLVIPASKVRAPNRTPVIDRTADKRVGTTIPATYTVQAGDKDLYQICRRFYGRGGEGARVVRIMDMNNLVSARVRAGTKLKLPRK